MDRIGLAAAYSSSTGLHIEGNTLYIRRTTWDHGMEVLARDLNDDMSLPLSNIANFGGAMHTYKMDK